MKIRMMENFKNVLTVADMDAVKEIREQLKDDNDTDWYARIMLSIAGCPATCEREILKFTATIAKNANVSNRYTENSGMLDVWLKVYAYEPCYGFYEIGAYITDVWDAANLNLDEIKERMYIRRLTDEHTL